MLETYKKPGFTQNIIETDGAMELCVRCKKGFRRFVGDIHVYISMRVYSSARGVRERAKLNKQVGRLNFIE